MSEDLVEYMNGCAYVYCCFPKPKQNKNESDFQVALARSSTQKNASVAHKWQFQSSLFSFHKSFPSAMLLICSLFNVRSADVNNFAVYKNPNPGRVPTPAPPPPPPTPAPPVATYKCVKGKCVESSGGIAKTLCDAVCS
jgi:hypothetical protein